MGYSITWNYTSKPYQEGDEYESNDLNMTYNLGRMMDWAFESPDWDKDIKGKTGKEILPMAVNAFHKMALNREEAEQYDSPNGWGTYTDALKFLYELIMECQKYENLYCDVC